MSSKIYFRIISPKHLKFFAYIIFFTMFSFVSEIHLLPQISAQQVNKINKKNGDEQKILAEIKIAKVFIENQEWEKARVKLRGIINDSPNNQHLDIAYYWLAYALFQQKKFSEAERIIEELKRKFPDSAWIDESQSLLVEINSQNGRQSDLTSEEVSKSDDETKAFFIQNLLDTDRPKALEIIDEILGAASKASDNLKESVLLLLFDDKSDWATDKFIQIIKKEPNENLVRQSLIGLKNRDEKKILPVLRDFLQQNTNERLFDAALYSVSNLPGESAIGTLIYVAKNGVSENLKQKSIIWIGNLRSTRATAELKNLYWFFTEIELKKQVQISLGEMNSGEALRILADLIESETNNVLIEHGMEILKRKDKKYPRKKLPNKN